MEEYFFNQKIYHSIPEVINAMGQYWKQGREFLYSGKFRSVIKNTDASLANSCMYIEKKYREDSEKGNLLFLKWLVRTPGIQHLYWIGKDYGKLNDICELMKSSSNADAHKLFLLMIQEQIMGDFVKNSGRQELTVANVRYLERSYSKKDTKFDRSQILDLMYYVIKENKVFLYDGQQFNTLQDLTDYLQIYADKSKEQLAEKTNGLFRNDYNFTAAFEGWLLNLGYHKELTVWKDRFQTGSPDSDPGSDTVYLKDIEIQQEAREQSNADFFKETASFDIGFTHLLENYPEILMESTTFSEMLKAEFKDKDLQIYLIEILYKMDIVKAINEAEELNNLFISRFIKRMSSDFGIKEDFARWAASVWCVSYGQNILHKRNRVMLYHGIT